MLKQLIIILLLLLSLQVYSQSVPFDIKFFPGREAEFKEASRQLNKGMKLMSQGEAAYGLALPFLEHAQVFNPSNAILNLNIGICLIRTSRQFESLDYFLKAKVLDAAVDPDLNYWLGNGYQLNSKWDEAISSYNSYLSVLDVKDAQLKQGTLKKIKECESGKLLSNDTLNVEITNLGKVNSSEGDYIPLISADGKLLFFTSRRPGTTGNNIDEFDGKYFEDVYLSNKEDNGWSFPKNLGAPINTEEHDAGVGLSVDGHSLILFRGENGGDLFLTTNNGFTWTVPQSMGSEINSENHESSACFAPDGRTLYFVSDREGGFGGRDIYKTVFNEQTKTWSKAENLGPVINSSEDEEGVFIHPDGINLYFSSKGHNTIGGYDIFQSVFDGTKWSTPVNLGIPVNTPGDEVFFQVSADGRIAYYSSYRKGGAGEKDLYKIEFLQRKEPVSKMVLLQGKIIDSETGLPLAAEIEVVDLEVNKLVGRFKNDLKTGEYLISLPAGKNYGTVVTAPGYLFDSENFDLKDSSGYKEVTHDVQLKPIKPGNGIVLHNIFFETAKFQLKESSKNELNRVVELMKYYPSLRVEIDGHTDNVGSEAYNLELSQKRANSVKEFLIELGITADRFVTNGYGFSKPKASNDTADGRSQNRRIEMIVISN